MFYLPYKLYHNFCDTQERKHILYAVRVQRSILFLYVANKAYLFYTYEVKHTFSIRSKNILVLIYVQYKSLFSYVANKAYFLCIQEKSILFVYVRNKAYFFYTYEIKHTFSIRTKIILVLGYVQYKSYFFHMQKIKHTFSLEGKKHTYFTCTL